ncbi:MAG: 50S ribosomal protein L10 [Pseudomonadota bacterium]
MPLTLEQKKQIVTEVAEVASSALSATVADYRGLTVAEMNELRAKARVANVYLRIVRNTLARRALEGTEFACLQKMLTGSLLIAFSKTEPSASARLIRDFVEEHEKLQVKALAINGEMFSASHLNAIAKLPTRHEALALLLSVMQAPISKFVRTLAEPCAKFVRTVAAVRDKKQAA